MKNHKLRNIVRMFSISEEKVNGSCLTMSRKHFHQAELWCIKSVKRRGFFWSLFFRIWTEYAILQNNICISPSLGKTDQKNIFIWTFLTQYYLRYFLHFYQLFFIFSPWFSFSLYPPSLNFFCFVWWIIQKSRIVDSHLKIDPMVFKLA